MSALTNEQKRHLAQLSERAFNRAAAQARGRGETVDTSTKARTAWRHAEVVKACGKLGLCCCSQLDYKAVEAHFLDLLGEHGRAFNAQMRAATEERRQAEAILSNACKRAGLHLNYAAAICQNQFKCSLFDASTDQLWKLIFTVRNRAKRKVAA